MALPTGPIQIIGKVEHADGTPFNGAFLFQLNTYGSVLPSAGGYIGISANDVVRVPIVDGQVQTSPSVSIYGNDAMQGNTWYIVQLVTSSGVILWTQNFEIIGANPFDMGSAQPFATASLPSVLQLGQLLGQMGEPGPQGVPGAIGPPGTATATSGLLFTDTANGRTYLMQFTNGELQYNQIS
jgi:hypothetical protein